MADEVSPASSCGQTAKPFEVSPVLLRSRPLLTPLPSEKTGTRDPIEAMAALREMKVRSLRLCLVKVVLIISHLEQLQGLKGANGCSRCEVPMSKSFVGQRILSLLAAHEGPLLVPFSLALPALREMFTDAKMYSSSC